MNRNELIENAKAKKFTIEFSETRYGTELIGINKGKWNYHWFEVMGDSVYFNHTYSQLTGRTKKGVMHSIRVKTSLGFYNQMP
jgi:hypothetical protein